MTNDEFPIFHHSSCFCLIFCCARRLCLEQTARMIPEADLALGMGITRCGGNRLVNRAADDGRQLSIHAFAGLEFRPRIGSGLQNRTRGFVPRL